MPTVLVVDDESKVRGLLIELLRAESLDIVEAEDGRAALAAVATAAPDAVILDLRIPEIDGMEVLRQLRASVPQLPVIMLTSDGDIRTAVEAMRLGAYDYITKPFNNHDLVLRVRRALERQALVAEVDTLKRQLAETHSLKDQMGPSDAIKEVIRRVQQVAPSGFSVLLQGETGTGKELVARAIHRESARGDKPFVALDCGAIPETLIESELFGHEKGAFTGADRQTKGQFQLADGGTLFLDEVANLPLTTQSKLLRALQERQIRPVGGDYAIPVDVRIISASNLPLEAATREGRFRQDLYYRLNEFTVLLPPLRARPDDIIPLATRFLGEASMELKRPARGFSEEAMTLLREHPWPGNVRELRNVVRRAVLVTSDLIQPEHLWPFEPRAPGAPLLDDASPEAALPTLRQARDRATADAERQVIRRALRLSRGNKREAAELLKTDYKTLHLKVKRYGIRPSDFIPRD